MKKRIIAVVMALFCTTALIACKDKVGKAGGTNTDGLLNKGKLVVATNASFPPFEYVGDDGKPDGFDVALVKSIGDELGLKVEIEDMEFDSLMASIGTKVDASIAGMTITEERAKAVDFSDPYYEAVQYVLVAKGSKTKTYDDLKGKKIGSQMGTTGDLLSEDIKKDENSTEVDTYDKAIDAVNDLVSGRLDAVILDKNPAEVFAKQYDKIEAMDGKAFGFKPEQYAIAMPKGDVKLTKKVNAALKTLKTNGTYDKLVRQYIETE